MELESINEIVLDKPKVILMTGKDDETKEIVHNFMESLLLDDYKVHLVFNNRRFYPNLLELRTKYYNLHVYPTKDISFGTLKEIRMKLESSIDEHQQHIMFIVGFTDQFTADILAVLYLITRKYKTSTVFISHFDYSKIKRFSPRMKECVDYCVRYLPN